MSSCPGMPGETGLKGAVGHTGKMGPSGDKGITKEITHLNPKFMFRYSFNVNTASVSVIFSLSQCLCLIQLILYCSVNRSLISFSSIVNLNIYRMQYSTQQSNERVHWRESYQLSFKTRHLQNGRK